MREAWERTMTTWGKAGKKFAPMLLVLMVGMVLLMLPEETQKQPRIEGGLWEEEFELERFEEKLERILSQVEGAGETEVVLMLDTGARAILAQDQKRSTAGEESRQVVTIGKGAGEQEVVTLQTISPDFRGAVVVCPGGDDPQVRLKLIQAVTVLTGLGADRIAVSRGNL